METKQFILLKSFELFLKKGYQNTSMSDLVNETKLSKGAFYHHFKNKEMLYQEVINVFFLSYFQEVEWKGNKNLNVSDIELMIKEFNKYFISEITSISDKGMSRYFIMFFEAYENHPKFKKIVKEFYKKLQNQLIIAFKKKKVEKPKIEAIKLIAKYEGLLFWVAIFPKEKVKELIDKL